MLEQMTNADFAQALKTHPCPECGATGFLEPQKMLIRVMHNRRTVEAQGEGTICRACNVKFMDDNLTESVMNQIQRIEGSATSYIEVDRETGELRGHPLQ